MPAESLHCPNCAAPLLIQPGQTLALCAYCNSSIKITLPTSGQTESTLAVEQVSPATIVRVKQLLLDGQRAEAVRLYSAEGGGDLGEAEKAVSSLYSAMVVDALGGQPLTWLGWTWLALYVVLLAGAMVFALWRNAAGSPALGLLVGGPIALFAGFNLWFFGRNIPATLLLGFGQPAEAEILKAARIGDYKVRGLTAPAQLVRLWLEVRPPGGAPQRVEMTRIVKSESVDRLQPGVVIAVRCDSRRPERVIPEIPLKVRR
jgi:hypothetical protein